MVKTIYLERRFVMRFVMNDLNTCESCINYEDGLCDRYGVLVDPDDSCQKYTMAQDKNDNNKR